MVKPKPIETPIRRLDGITYWVIEDPNEIHDFINTEIRREWEADAKFEGRNPRDDPWLKTLSQRRWSLRIVDIKSIKPNPRIMNYVDTKRGYVFSESLEKRGRELKKDLETYGLVIWPLIVRREDWILADGYCRHATLKAMNVRRIYAYIGTL